MRFNYRSAAVLVALIYNRPRGPGTKRGGKKTSVQGRRKCRPQNSPSLLRFSQLLFFFFAPLLERGGMKLLKNANLCFERI